MAKKIQRNSVPVYLDNAFTYPLSALPGENQPAPGRPSAITDDELFYRWGEIRRRFEEIWGDVGWNLKHIKKPEDVIRVFSLLDSGNTATTSGRLLACLLKPSFASVTPRQLRDSRRNYHQAIERRYNLGQQYEAQQNQVSEAETALREAEGLVNAAKNKTERRKYEKILGLVEEELQGRKENLSELQTSHKLAEHEETKLRDALEEEEPAFARAEVVRFVRSKRYKLTPKKVADAIAGLPYMVWRQSVRRCSGFDDKDNRSASLFYQAFEFFKFSFNSRKPRSIQAALRLLRGTILKPSKTFTGVRQYCKENWACLKEAVGQVLGPTTRTAQFPYKLAAAFRKSILQPRTALQRVIMSICDRFPE